MLGERDRESRRAACSSSCPTRASNLTYGGMGPPAPPPSSSSLFSSLQRPSQPQHLSSLDAGSFALFSAKLELSDPLEARNAENVMATRQASLVVPSAAQEEPEQEQEEVRTENSKSEAKKPGVHVIKRRNVGVPKFLRFLFQILEVENPEIITWSHEGTAFQIIQTDELANQILPKYFKHNKVSSFQRQLNYFGFKKWTKTQTNTCTFSHPFFLRADKERMKLIKRKERANPAVMSAAMAATIKSNPIHIMNRMQEQEQARAQFESHDLAEARSQLPMQQALKRQKSNTLSGTTVTFLNSASAGRRHSTGMLPGSEAFGLAAAAAAAAAAASSAPGRKRAGTPAEQEFELEMEARSDAAANASSMQQQFLYMRKIAEAKEISQRYPYEAARGKRQSLPLVLPPGFGDVFGMGMNMAGSSANGSFAPRSAINLGRRKSDQVLTDYNLSGASGVKQLSISQIEDFMSSSTAPSLPQTIFASNCKGDASVVLPISSNSFGQATYLLKQRQGQQRSHDHQQQQQFRQQMNRQQNIFGAGSGYGVKAESGSGWSTSIKTESCSGWPTAININSSSGGNASYPPQLQSHSMLMPFKFGDSNSSQSMPSYHGIVGFQHGGELQRPQMQHQYQSQHVRTASYEQQQQSNEQQESRDYIDVLLESEGLDDNLPPQTSTTLTSESWNEPSYVNPQQEPSTSGPNGPYSFMQPQQQDQQQLHLSPMGGMSHSPNQRF